MSLTHKEWMRRCIEECKTCGNLNTASGAERLIEKFAGHVDETYGALSEEKCETLDLFYSALIHGKANPKKPLDIITYPGGDNQPTHPKVLYFPNGWNGHKYWMTYSPYPDNNNFEENPCITYSDDGIKWSETGINNPIVATEHSGCYYSDPHLVYKPETKTLELWVRYCSNGTDGKTQGWEGVYRLKSTDGVNWSEKEYLYHVVDTVAQSLVSPSIIFDEGRYKIWVCYKRQCLKYYESADGTNWRFVKDISNGITPIGVYKLWHFDMIKTPVGYEFVGCYQYNGEFNLNNYIAYSRSEDNENFETPTLVLANGEEGQFDDLELYRPCLVKIGNKYRMYYGAQKDIRIWHIGVVETPNMYLLGELLKKGANELLPEYSGAIPSVNAANAKNVYVMGSRGDNDAKWMATDGVAAATISGGTWDENYLALDGVDDCIVLPVASATKLRLAFKSEHYYDDTLKNVAYLLDCRTAATNYILYSHTNTMSGVTLTVDGVAVANINGTSNGKWQILEITFASAFTGSITIGARYEKNECLKCDIAWMVVV